MKPHVRPLIFMHIPKTAGTTINQILENEYDKIFRWNHLNKGIDFKTLSSEEKRKIDVINGHLEFGVHEFYPGDITYFSFLRDPIERIISNYYFLYMKKEHYFNKEMQKNQYSLKEMLKGGYIKNFNNCHVRFFAGDKDVEYGLINKESYRKAIVNFDTYFKSFGLSERFDESILLFQNAFNWKTPYYVKANVTRKHNYKVIIDDETTELLKHYNHYDIAFYAYAREKFNKIITNQGPDFQNKLKRFRFYNRIQNPFRKAAIHVKFLFN